MMKKRVIAIVLSVLLLFQGNYMPVFAEGIGETRESDIESVSENEIESSVRPKVENGSTSDIDLHERRSLVECEEVKYDENEGKELEPEATDTILVRPIVTYGQAEARRAAAMVNSFRTQDNVWAWKEDDINKQYYSGLNALTYDYYLEQKGIQSALNNAMGNSLVFYNEGAYSYAITPRGMILKSDCMLASAEDVLEYLRADDLGYAGQSYRRQLLLEPSARSIGIGHIKIGGVDYWGIQIGFSNSGAQKIDYYDKEQFVPVNVKKSNIQSVEARVPAEIVLNKGEVVDLPIVTSTWRFSSSSNPISIRILPLWDMMDESSKVIRVREDKIYADNAGMTKIEMNLNGKEYFTVVTVPNNTGIPVGFTLGKDNNNFIHSNGKGYGFEGYEYYYIDKNTLNEVKQRIGVGAYNVLKEEQERKREWTGSCYGIAVSMALLYNKDIKIDSLTNRKNIQNYYSLGKPCNDTRFLSLINYYQLSQSFSIGGESYATDAVTYSADFSNLINRVETKGEIDLQTFLKRLVNAVRNSGGRAIVMTYSYKDGSHRGGHTVLLTDYKYDRTKKEYTVYVYDENNETGFYEMIIPDDFRGFTYKGSREIHKCFREIRILSLDKMKNILLEEAMNNHMMISIGEGKKIKISNAKGEYLEYDGNNISGNMKVYDIFSRAAENGKIVLEVDKTSQLVVSDCNEKIDVEVCSDDSFMGVEGEGISGSVIDLYRGINIEGGNANFIASITTDYISNNEKGLVIIEGTSDSNVDLLVDGTGIEATSPGIISNVVVKSVYGNNTYSRNYERIDASKGIQIDSNCNIMNTKQIMAFVSRMYTVALGRDAEEAGLNDWSSQLINRQSDGATLARGFICSQEFINKNMSDEQYIDILYRTFFNREADEGGKVYWLGELSGGRSRTGVLSGFVNSVEFGNLCDEYGIARGTMEEDGSNVYNAGVRDFVLRNYEKALGRRGETAGVEDWSHRINTGQMSALDVAQSFFHSQEFLNKNTSNEEYVEILYETFLGRASDSAGKADWVSQLNGGKSRDEVMKGFAYSQEFKNIMAQYGL